VENGTFDAGLTGKDWIEENQSQVVVVDDLIYSKTSQKPARWVLAVLADSAIKELKDLEGKKIATELVNFTERYFKERGIHAEVEFSWGATEAKVVSGLADAVVEVTETGSTIKAHGLKIIHELMESNTQLIANRQSYKDAWKKAKIEQIILLLRGALRAENMVGLKMNVPKEKLEEIIDQLPSLNAPTVAGLHNTTWVSLEVVVDSRVVRELIPQLMKAGAEGIIEYALNKVI
jgi:ATP phosphoribosyltransferase